MHIEMFGKCVFLEKIALRPVFEFSAVRLVGDLGPHEVCSVACEMCDFSNNLRCVTFGLRDCREI